MGFNERPMRHYLAFTAARACTKRAASRDDLAVCTWSTNLNIQIIRIYLLFTISYRTSNRQTGCLASCKLGSLNDVFASCPATNSKPWWRRTGSNRRPPACKAGALPAELRPRKVFEAKLRKADLAVAAHAACSRSTAR
jgi:hypothetical protein